MKDRFGELAKGLAQSVPPRGALRLGKVALLCLAIGADSSVTRAEDLYVDGAAASSGDGSAARPYWRITDAVGRARNDRQNAIIPAEERIVIHVAAGTYRGSYDAQKLAANPQWEMLPIILNVPNLTLSGATVLELDASGLPVRVRPGPETVLTTPDAQLFSAVHTLILVARTTDGGAGDGVTVTGFDLKQKQGGSADGLRTFGIYVDRVSDFAIRGNAFLHTPGGLVTRLASGRVENNLLTCYKLGGVISGGSITQPSAVTLGGNRSMSGSSGEGIILSGAAALSPLDLGANTLSLPTLQSVYDRNKLEDRQNIPDSLDAIVSGNDFSGNASFGLRMWAYPPSKYATTDPAQPLTAAVHATISGNTFTRNGEHGAWVDAGWAPRGLPYGLTAVLAARFQDNLYLGNARGPALFSFGVPWVSVGLDTLQENSFLISSTFQITDVDCELAGFDYDNPAADPLDGSPLNNTLIVNGNIVPQGTRITPSKP